MQSKRFFNVVGVYVNKKIKINMRNKHANSHFTAISAEVYEMTGGFFLHKERGTSNVPKWHEIGRK